VLNDESGLPRVEDEALDYARGDQTLLSIKIPAQQAREWNMTIN
jgi:hypothetical protein